MEYHDGSGSASHQHRTQGIKAATLPFSAHSSAQMELTSINAGVFFDISRGTSRWPAGMRPKNCCHFGTRTVAR